MMIIHVVIIELVTNFDVFLTLQRDKYKLNYIIVIISPRCMEDKRFILKLIISALGVYFFALQIIPTPLAILNVYIGYVIRPVQIIIKYYTYNFVCFTCSIITLLISIFCNFYV